LLRIVKQNRKRTLSDTTGDFNQNRNDTVSRRTVQRKLYSKGYHRRVVVKRIRIREINRKIRVNWCRTNRRRTVGHYWKRVIFSDECKVDIGTDNKVFIWRKVGEDWLPCQGWRNQMSELPESYICLSGQLIFFNLVVRG
jgi:hypothetical protein